MFVSPGTFGCTEWQIVTDISKEWSAFSFMINQSKDCVHYQPTGRNITEASETVSVQTVSNTNTTGETKNKTGILLEINRSKAIHFKECRPHTAKVSVDKREYECKHKATTSPLAIFTEFTECCSIMVGVS